MKTKYSVKTMNAQFESNRPPPAALRLTGVLLPVVLLLCLTAGCGTERRQVKFQPSAVGTISAEKKLPLSAALVLDKDFKTYGILVKLVGGSASYQIGDQLSTYAQDVSRNLFKQVTVVDTPAGAAGQADVVLIPRAVRSEYYNANPLRVLIVVEWTVNDRAGQQMLWLTSIETETTEGLTLFSHSKHERIAFQRAFDDLSQKTLKAFNESPEIIRLTGNRQ
jgi:hypothetical protein